jgi:hypothetical protein
MIVRKEENGKRNRREGGQMRGILGEEKSIV